MKKTILLLIKTYQIIVSPFLVTVFGHSCKFNPTCSKYSMIAIQRHGVVKGIKLTLVRLSKCHPFSRTSWFDPVPEI